MSGANGWESAHNNSGGGEFSTLEISSGTPVPY